MGGASGASLADLLTDGRQRVAAAVAAIASGHAAAVRSLAERYPGRDLAGVVAERPVGLSVELAPRRL